MSILNRRNAVVGWIAWLTAKRVLKRKVKAAVPGTVEGTRRPNKGAIAVGVAALAGLFWFWKRASPGDENTPEPPAES
ncbi:MAG: hypothetical protein H0V68_10980 [Actinobacteria bacterium]|nr:hypothetical protein [Actinomycetota bacterium]